MRFICKHTMNEHSLPKSEKLCSRTAINRLFAEGSAFIVYPLRVVYRIDDDSTAPPQFFVNIPKRKFKRPSSGSICADASAKPIDCTRRF